MALIPPRLAGDHILVRCEARCERCGTAMGLRLVGQRFECSDRHICDAIVSGDVSDR